MGELSLGFIHEQVFIFDCSAAVGNRSSKGCFSSSIKSTSSAYSISSGSPSGEIGGFGLVELSRTDDKAAAR